MDDDNRRTDTNEPKGSGDLIIYGIAIQMRNGNIFLEQSMKIYMKMYLVGTH